MVTQNVSVRGRELRGNRPPVPAQVHALPTALNYLARFAKRSDLQIHIVFLFCALMN